MNLLLAALLLVTPVERELRGGESHEYAIELKAGEFAMVTVDQRGIDVIATAFAPGGAKLAEVDSPNGANGPEPVPIAATTTGPYRIEVRSFDAKAAPGKYQIRVEERLTRREYQKRLAAEKARDAAVVQWMAARAIPLGDLTKLRPALDGVRVVGLGEATHGSREIVQFKKRMVEFLAGEGYTLLAVEASVSAMEVINEYVHGGGDRRSMLAALKDCTWILDTEEFLSVIEWLRANGKSMRIVGIDPQGSGRALDFVRDFVQRPEFTALLATIRVQDANALRFERTEITPETLQGLYRLVSFLVLHEGDLVRRTSQRDYDRALGYARQFAQFGEFNSGNGSRDQAMADHLFLAMKPGEKAIVWAHNSHIAARETGSYPPLGGFLRKAFGAGYYAIATSFDRGSFLAQKAGVSPPSIRTFSISSTEGTVDSFLAQATSGDAFVDLRHAPPSDPRIAEWLQAPHAMHWVGAIFSEQWAAPQWVQPFVLRRDFDGLAFIESTTASRPRGE